MINQRTIRRLQLSADSLSGLARLVATTVTLALLTPTLVQSAEPAAAEAVTLTGRTMGTTFRIKYWGDGASTVAEVREAVDKLLAEFDRQMSTYRDDSELSQFKRAPANEWFAVSAATAHVVNESIKYHRLTGGTLDVTVPPVLRLWHFGAGADKDAGKLSPPSPAEIEATMGLVGSQRLHVRLNPPALSKELAGIEVDLSSIAPGYAVDLIIDQLKSLGFLNAMVEIGGEVRGVGARPDGTPWRIGVERVDGDGRLARIVPLDNLALSTAGDYRNYRTADGQRYTHIIDARTGQALSYRGAAVSVIADTCIEADALDTPLLIMGASAGYQWCVDHQIAAFFQERNANGEIVERATPRFEQLAPR